MLRYIRTVGLALVLLFGVWGSVQAWHLSPLPEGADDYARIVCTFAGALAVKEADDAAPPETTEAFDEALQVQQMMGQCSQLNPPLPVIMVEKVDRLAQEYQGNIVWMWRLYMFGDRTKTSWYAFSPFTPVRLMGVSI